MEDARKRIEEGNITDEMLMHLVILPLTYKGEEKKQKAIKDCVDLAKQISDKEQETFALAGILAFTDKIISDEMKQYIKEVLVGFPCRFESSYPHGFKNAENPGFSSKINGFQRFYGTNINPFHLIPGAGCGQSPQALIDAGFPADYSW